MKYIKCQFWNEILVRYENIYSITLFFLLACNLISVLSFVEAYLFSLKIPRHLYWLKFIFFCRCSILFYQIGLSVTKLKHAARDNVTSCLVIKKFFLTV